MGRPDFLENLTVVFIIEPAPVINYLRYITLAGAERIVMKIKMVALLLVAAIPNMGCAAAPGDFEMTVEEVYELNGFVLKGIYVGGTIKSGCIANTDEYALKRDGKIVIETIGRIFEVVKKPGAESAVKGDYVKLYIPDVKAEDFKVGDVATSGKTSCK